MSFLQALQRPPTSVVNVLRIRCTRKRGYVAHSASAEMPSKAPTSPNPSSSPAATSSTPFAAVARSSCPPTTLLKGVNYLKGQPPVLALEDSAYPEWLWDTLKPRVYEDDGPGGKKERMERRKANRQAIKDRNFMQTQ